MIQFKIIIIQVNSLTNYLGTVTVCGMKHLHFSYVSCKIIRV